VKKGGKRGRVEGREWSYAESVVVSYFVVAVSVDVMVR